VKFLALFASILCAATLAAQDPIRGEVRTVDTGEQLPAANVMWRGTTIGTTTDMDGRFSIAPPPAWPAELQVSFVGYAPAVLPFTAPPTAPVQVTLRWAVEIRAVEVVERASGTLLDARTINATERIGQKELKRAACCDLSESFETNATVDVQYSDAVSGAKTIRMLGLDGRYAQIGVENIPFLRGLSGTSGLTLLPGTWIKDINLSKGVGTAVNGPNAMSGQIELCLLNPLEEPPLFVNAYGNSQGRAELNVHSAQRTGRQSANLLLLHGNLFELEMDQNGDMFMDMPLTRRINVMDRWLYQGERRSAQVNVRYVNDRRSGGQSVMHGAKPLGEEHTGHRPLELYRIQLDQEMVDVFAKSGFVFRNDPTKSVGLIVALRHHTMDATYGLRNYTGQQQSAYVNAVYQQLLRDGNDGLKAGLSYQVDDYTEVLRDTLVAPLDLSRLETMPGLFAEHSMKRGALNLVSGVRVDVNEPFGTVVSPRLHARYELAPLTTLRASVGRGFRTPNPLVEQPAVLASSRRITFQGELGMERAWNFGVSMLHKFKWLGRKWALGLDTYHSRFTQQLVADLDRSPLGLAFYMLDGPSFANSLLTDVQVNLSRDLLLRVSHRYYDVLTTFDGRLLERPFTPRHRGLVDLSYAGPKERWRYDVSLNLFGDARMPATDRNPPELRMPERSPAYATLHAQITHVRGNVEFYVGGENLTSTLQREQIIAADDPFGPYFDATLIWGPTNRAMVYGGLRFRLDRTTQEPTPPTP
jgi:hypothetical protein